MGALSWEIIMSDKDFGKLEALAEKSKSLCGVYLRRSSGFATSYEILTHNHELWLANLTRNDAEIVVGAVNSFAFLVSEKRRLENLSFSEQENHESKPETTLVLWRNYPTHCYASFAIQNTGTGLWTYKIVVHRTNKSHIDTQYLWMSCDEFHDTENEQSEFVFKTQSKYNLCKEWLLSKMWMHIYKGCTD